MLVEVADGRALCTCGEKDRGGRQRNFIEPCKWLSPSLPFELFTCQNYSDNCTADGANLCAWQPLEVVVGKWTRGVGVVAGKEACCSHYKYYFPEAVLCTFVCRSCLWLNLFSFYPQASDADKGHTFVPVTLQRYKLFPSKDEGPYCV
jgi:hypothetical protein